MIEEGPARTVNLSWLGVESQGLSCLLPIGSVYKIVPLMDLVQSPGGPKHRVGFCNLLGESIPVHDLGMMLGETHLAPYSIDTHVIVLEHGRTKMGLVVSRDVAILKDTAESDLVPARAGQRDALRVLDDKQWIPLDIERIFTKASDL